MPGLAGKLDVLEQDGFITIRLRVEGLRVDFKDGVLELKVPVFLQAL